MLLLKVQPISLKSKPASDKVEHNFRVGYDIPPW